MAGLDTSHVGAFANLLHDSANPHHVPGARIVAAFPGGSADFEQSIGRVEGFTANLRDSHGVEIVESIEGLRGKCDAIMLESIDGRVHLPQFREIVQWGLPVFIDKPLTISADEARELVALARQYEASITSASALRYAEDFRTALRPEDPELIFGADFYGPMSMVEMCPGYFWYGIHTAEMLFATLGRGCRDVSVTRENTQDVIVGRWADGRLGVLRGNREGNSGFGGVLHRRSGSKSFAVSSAAKPFYVSLLEKVIPFFRGESTMVELDEMVEVIAFLEAANQSAASGERVTLS